MRIKSITATLLLAALPSHAPAATLCGPNGCYLAPAPAGRAPARAQSPAPPQEVLRSTRSVVRVVHRAGQGASIGSATLVAHTETQSYYLTCAHLFDDGSGTTTVRTARGELRAEVTRLDRAHDLALLRTARGEGEPVAEGPAPTGGLLVACGLGSDGALRCVSGPVVGHATPVGASSPSLRIRGAVRPGDSGGPVFDPRGRLVGVVWGERGGESYATFGAPLRRFFALLPRPTQRPLPVPREGAIAGANDWAAAPPSAPSAPADPSDPSDRPGWRREIEQRIESLANRPPASSPAIAPGVLDRFATRDDLASLASEVRDAASRLKEAARRGATAAATTTQAVGARELLYGALGVGAPIGAGLLLGQLFFRIKKSEQRADRTGRPTSQPQRVAVDSPPPPQRVVPETHYVSYERDDFARAHQWASEQLARKFPGSVEWLSSLDSLIKQQIAGRRTPNDN